MEILYALVTAMYMGGGQGYEFAYSHPTLLTENECRVMSKNMNLKVLKGFTETARGFSNEDNVHFYCIPTVDVTLFKECLNQPKDEPITPESFMLDRSCARSGFSQQNLK